MAEDVDAGEIERSQRGALRPPQRRPGNGVNFFRRVLAGRYLLEDTHDAVERDVVADEVRRVLRDDDALAEPLIGKLPDGLDDLRQRVGAGNNLEQLQVPGRIEEVCTEPVAAEVLTAPLPEHRDGDAGRVGADDRSLAPQRVYLLEQRPLDVQALDHGLHDPVHVGDAPQVFVEASRGDQLPRVRREEGVGLQGTRPLQPFRGCGGCEVEEERRHAGIGEMSGNLGAHRAGAEDRDVANHVLSLTSAALCRYFPVGPLSTGQRSRGDAENTRPQPPPHLRGPSEVSASRKSVNPIRPSQGGQRDGALARGADDHAAKKDQRTGEHGKRRPGESP